MIVCVCNAINERQLRTCGRTHQGDAEEVYRALGYEPQCCQCLEEAEEVLENARLCAA